MAETQKQLEERMAEGFLPHPSTQVDMRGHVAAEYMAFFLGRIDKKLGRLIELLERQSGQA